MKLRQTLNQHRQQNGPIERVIAYLSLRGFTSYDALVIPFHWLFATIMLATPVEQTRRSPVYSTLIDLAPVWCWALLLIVLAATVVSGIWTQSWITARLAYVLISAWWFAIAGLIYLAATTLLSPAVYVLISVSCLYRQAEVALVAEYGHD